MSATIEIKNVSKRFGETVILDDISLSIDAAEFVVFLGPSGCGKSTLLRMIAGLEDVSDGEIIIGNQRVDTLPPGKRGVAMVFQSYALYPHMTIRQNMSFGLENIGESRESITNRVKQAAEILEISHLLDRKPAMLSGGQRQRVAIGRAIVKEPKAFLFDEPLSNLDAALRGRTRLEIAQLHARLGSTMLFVTHDQVEAMTLANRIVVMHNKKIEQIGTPTEIYHYPATKFVAAFVGSPAMNFVSINSIEKSENAHGETSLEVNIDGVAKVNLAPRDLSGFILENAVLGIRAEETQLVSEPEGAIKLTIDVIERLGERTLLYGTLENGDKFVVGDSGHSTAKAGDTIYFQIDKNACHLFGGDGKAFHYRKG